MLTSELVTTGALPAILPSCGPTPTRASECSLCADSPPQTAVGQCACTNLYCDEHGGTCACGFTGCGLCLAHHPCPLDTWLPSPTLVEALDPALARHNSPEATTMSVQGQHLSSEQEQDKEKGTKSSTTADGAKEQEEDVPTENKAPWQQLAETLKRLPVRVEMLPGRGRNRTGPTEQWEPKKKRHDPCARKTKCTARSNDRCEDATNTDAATTRTEKKRKMPRAFAKGLLTEEELQQLHEERRARREAFDAFATSLQHSRRKRVRFAAKTNAASTLTTMSKDQDAPPPAPAAATNKQRSVQKLTGVSVSGTHVVVKRLLPRDRAAPMTGVMLTSLNG